MARSKGGLVGGNLTVESNYLADLDLFAVPLANGIAIRRVGCFLASPVEGRAETGTAERITFLSGRLALYCFLPAPLG